MERTEMNVLSIESFILMRFSSIDLGYNLDLITVSSMEVDSETVLKAVNNLSNVSLMVIAASEIVRTVTISPVSVSLMVTVCGMLREVLKLFTKDSSIVTLCSNERDAAYNL